MNETEARQEQAQMAAARPWWSRPHPYLGMAFVLLGLLLLLGIFAS